MLHTTTLLLYILPAASHMLLNGTTSHHPISSEHGRALSATCASSYHAYHSELEAKITLWKGESDDRKYSTILDVVGEAGAIGLTAAAISSTALAPLAVPAAMFAAVSTIRGSVHAFSHEDWPELAGMVSKLGQIMSVCFAELQDQITVLQAKQLRYSESNAQTWLKMVAEDLEYIENGDYFRSNWRPRLLQLEHAIKEVDNIYREALVQETEVGNGYEGSGEYNGNVGKPTGYSDLVWTSKVADSYTVLLQFHHEATKMVVRAYDYLKSEATFAAADDAFVDVGDNYASADEFLAQLDVTATRLLSGHWRSWSDGDDKCVDEIYDVCLVDEKNRIVEITQRANQWYLDATFARYQELVTASSGAASTVINAIRADEALLPDVVACSRCYWGYDHWGEDPDTPCELCHKLSILSWRNRDEDESTGSYEREATWKFKGEYRALYTWSYSWEHPKQWGHYHITAGRSPHVPDSSYGLSSIADKADEDIFAEYAFHFDLKFARTCKQWTCTGEWTKKGENDLLTFLDIDEAFCPNGECSNEFCCETACFDAATLFHTPSGDRRADELRVGDPVLAATQAGELVWDRIAVDSSHGAGTYHYLQVNTSNGHSITLSSNHFLHGSSDASAACCSSATLLTPDKLAVGYTIWTHSGGFQGDGSGGAPTGALSSARVTSITPVVREGAYNFLLEQAGDSHFRSVVAAGVAASSFTTDWRLLNSFGFDVADHLRDDLRELSLLAAERGEEYSPRNTTLMSILRQVEDVTADCVERHMANCTEGDLEIQFAQIQRRAFRLLGASVHDEVGHLIETLASKHTAYLPQVARRFLASASRRLATTLITTFDASTSEPGGAVAVYVISAAAKEAHTVAARVCSFDPSCADDMPHHHRTAKPHWSLFYRDAAIAAVIVITLISIAILIAVVFAVRHFTSTATHSATRAVVAVSDAHTNTGAKTAVGSAVGKAGGEKLASTDEAKDEQVEQV